LEGSPSLESVDREFGREGGKKKKEKKINGGKRRENSR
jgi:hypothetical protein